jgi:hypothetical protein
VSSWIVGYSQAIDVTQNQRHIKARPLSYERQKHGLQLLKPKPMMVKQRQQQRLLRCNLQPNRLAIDAKIFFGA